MQDHPRHRPPIRLLRLGVEQPEVSDEVRLVVGRDVVRPGHIVSNIGIKLGQGPASLKLSVSKG